MSIATAERDLPDGIHVERRGCRSRLVCFCGADGATVDALDHHELCPNRGGA